MKLPAGAATIVRSLQEGEGAISAVETADQAYVRASVRAPSPPWDKESYEILVAIPAAFDDGAALDAFYLRMPYKFNEGGHSRVDNGSSITVDGHEWRLVSWHYPEGKPWDRSRGDSIQSHIVHCAGFFAGRGAINGY